MNRLLALLAIIPLAAASPPRGVDLQTPSNPLGRNPLIPLPPRQPTAPPTAFQPAPLPNRDIDGLPAPRATGETSVSPSLFTHRDTYRGEGFSKGSTATSEQERRIRPGVGFNLKMPLSPN